MDADTGFVKVLRYVVVHDSGPIVNPILAHGNLIGGIAQGLGGALYEHMVYDDAAQLMTSSFMDYTVPTAVEIPSCVIEMQETASPFTLTGCKGVGESGVTSPLMIETVVVLPAPLGPSSATSSPRPTSNDTSSTATMEP